MSKLKRFLKYITTYQPYISESEWMMRTKILIDEKFPKCNCCKIHNPVPAKMKRNSRLRSTLKVKRKH